MILSVDLSQPFSLESEFWKSRRPLVLACGCFDLLTVGHVRHLEAARRMGDCLVVLVTPDRYIDKGPTRPVFSQEERAEMLDALRCVDLVIVNQHPTAMEALQCLKPDVYVKGKEYRKNISVKLKEEIAAACRVGCALAFTEAEETHTTDVLTALSQRCERAVLDFSDWTECKCGECCSDARRHAVDTEASLRSIANIVRSELL